jgi:hypothetical protein
MKITEQNQKQATKKSFSVGAILTVHAEGAMASVSYNSLLECCNYAESKGITVHKMVVLDRPTRQTRAVFDGLSEIENTTVLETDFGDQGLVRNKAVEACSADLIAFLDGDDLWGENWLHLAHSQLCNRKVGTIAHPEFNWFFQGTSSILIGTDQSDPNFSSDFLRFGNYWDAMCMAHRSTYLNNPYCKRAIKEGFAFEDWHWNCETYLNGHVHEIVMDSIHFKRRRADSQTIEASTNRSLMPQSEITSYRFTERSV